MSTAQQEYENPSATLDQLPAVLDSSNSKLVYLYLSTTEDATITELQSALDMKQLALFPVLQTLTNEGLISRNGDTVTITA